MLKKAAVLIIVLCLFTASGLRQLWGFGIEMDSSNFDPTGSGAIKNIYIQQDDDKYTPIEIYIQERNIGEDGKDILTDLANEEDFYIAPKQVLLKPKDQQLITIRYAGNPDVVEEKAYRLVFEEIPVNMNQDSVPEKNKMQVLLKHVIKKSIYVKPKDTAPDLVIEYAGISTGNISATDNNRLQVVVFNKGNGHVITNKIGIKLKSLTSTPSVTVWPEQFKSINILAKSKVKARMPWPKEIPQGVLTGDLIIERAE